MPITYRLSNQQRKDLLVRATPLRIVIPSPAEELSDDESERYAVSSLIDGRYVSRAYQTDVAVRPGGGGGLDGVIGEILPDQQRISQDELVYWIAVIIVYLDPPDEARHQRSPLQWPGQAVGPYGTWPRTSPEATIRKA